MVHGPQSQNPAAAPTRLFDAIGLDFHYVSKAGSCSDTSVNYHRLRTGSRRDIAIIGNCLKRLN